MNVVDKVIEFRNRISTKISEIDSRREHIASIYVNPDNYDIKNYTDESKEAKEVIDKLDAAFKEFDIRIGDFYEEVKNSHIVILSRLMDRNMPPKQLSLMSFLHASVQILNPILDNELAILKKARKKYHSIYESLSKLQESLETPKSEYAIERAKTIIDNIDFSDFEVGADFKDRFKVQCVTYIKEELIRIKKKKELELKEKEHALIEAKIKAAEEARLTEVKKELDEDEEEVFKSKILYFNKIKEVYDKWSYLFPNDLYTSEITSTYNYNDLYDLISYKYPDFDEEWYKLGLILALTINNQNTNDNDYYRDRVKFFIEHFSKQYEFYLEISDIENLKKEIWTNTSLTDEQYEILANFDAALDEIVNNNNVLNNEIENKLQDMKDFLHGIKKSSIAQKVNEDGKLPITSFIFFDYELDKETGERKAYVTTDLDPESTRSLIDKSLLAAKIKSNGYDDFCDLIDDLILYSKPRILLDNFDRIERIIRKIYYTKSSHGSVNDSSDNATDMVRIKPTLNSYVRFVDEKVELPAGSIKLKQVKYLLESKYPAVTIDEEKPFGLFINYLDTFKRSAKENYSPSFGRQKDSKIRDVLKTETDAYTDEELRYLSDTIDFTMNTYSELEKMNSSFDFSIIKTIKNKTFK